MLAEHDGEEKEAAIVQVREVAEGAGGEVASVAQKAGKLVGGVRAREAIDGKE